MTSGSRLLTPLCLALLCNAAFSVLSAAALVLFAGQFGSFTGIPEAVGPRMLAFGLLGYGGWLLSVALRREIKLGDARIAVVMDIVWVAVTVPLGVLYPLTPAGRWLVLVASAAVFTFALLQWRGIQAGRVAQATACD